MNHPEEAMLLTSVLDRHLEQLTRATTSHDWRIYWSLSPFLALLETEPVLAGILKDYSEDADRFAETQESKVISILERAAALFDEYEIQLNSLREAVGESKWNDFEFGAFRAVLSNALGKPCEIPAAVQLTSRLRIWISFAGGENATVWGSSDQQTISDRIELLYRSINQVSSQVEQLIATHPGVAHDRLKKCFTSIDYAATEDHLADHFRNKEAERIRQSIRESEQWADVTDGLPQPAITQIQRDVRVLHLALVTSLARGQSRWATVRRFAARCETFDRQRLIETLAQLEQVQRSHGKVATPEAFLTMEFSRYLFDAGFNPLVDVNACGLRPDVLDATTNPAIYVEAKQYENVAGGIAAQLRKNVAQAVNTWGRLLNRWNIPEAFLLVFRRSGRPILLDESELRVLGRRLYVCCVDLTDASEAGSRAREPVRVTLKDFDAEASS